MSGRAAGTVGSRARWRRSGTRAGGKTARAGRRRAREERCFAWAGVWVLTMSSRVRVIFRFVVGSRVESSGVGVQAGSGGCDKGERERDVQQ